MNYFQLHKSIRENQKGLNGEYKDFFQKLSYYLRTSFIIKQTLLETLYEVSEHLLILQKDNKDIKDFYDDDLKSFSHSLKKSTSRFSVFERFIYFSILFILILSCALMVGGLHGILTSFVSDNVNGLFLNGWEILFSLSLVTIMFFFEMIVKKTKLEGKMLPIKLSFLFLLGLSAVTLVIIFSNFNIILFSINPLTTLIMGMIPFISILTLKKKFL